MMARDPRGQRVPLGSTLSVIGSNERDTVSLNAVSINIDDSVLVQKSQAGDVLAMERLILKYQNRIYNVILKMCGNPDDAAELTQEAFVKVIESIGKFKGRSSFYTWLFRIAVNLTLNYCQRNAKRATRSLDAEENEPDGQSRQVLKDFPERRQCGRSGGAGPTPGAVRLGPAKRCSIWTSPSGR